MRNIITNARTGYGTGEWSDASRNCVIGCSNDCAYCYARANATKSGAVVNRESWLREKIDEKEIKRKHTKINGLVMFPTRHDTTPANLKYTLPYLTGLLEAGNQVLFVSKAHLSCIKELCTKLVGFKDQLLIRVTIGSTNPMLCKFWERNAPRPEERMLALKHAQEAGFQTSVSMEPMLHGVEDAVKTFRAVAPFVTEKIWIGAMNGVTARVDISNPNFEKAVADLQRLQSQEELYRLYQELKDEPKVEWKESISQVVENREGKKVSVTL